MARKLPNCVTREKHRWGDKYYTRKNLKKGVKIYNKTDSKVSVHQEPSQQSVATTTTDNNNFVSLKQLLPKNLSRIGVSEDLLTQIQANNDVDNNVICNVVVNVHELDLVLVRFENRIKINVSAAGSKSVLGMARTKLASELELVRSLVKRLEAKELQLSESVDTDTLMVNSEVVPVIKIDSYEKDDRKPSMNQYYPNTEFDFDKDGFSVQGNNKKLKTNGFGSGFQLARAFKSCSNLLTRLGKHKNSWLFKAPVDVQKWNLHDYHTIIKHPMDFGTIRTKLTKKMYKSPSEFAEDVRLTFRNAMTYNPKGNDVLTMTEDFVRIFEEKWAVIEAEYSLDLIPDKWQDLRHDMELRTPASRKIPSHLRPSLMRDRPIPTTAPIYSRTEHVHPTPNLDFHKSTSPKKIKPFVRDMTFDEKQNLGLSLQSLPQKKQGHIFEIIKDHSSALSQLDGEIEINIDILDAETQWELDRFVSECYKSLGQDQEEDEPKPAAMNPPTPVAMEVDEPKAIRKENGSMAIQLDKQEKEGESSSSSSDSGSSSSDSDSGSSSGSE